MAGISDVVPMAVFQGTGSRGPFPFADGATAIPFAANGHLYALRIDAEGAAEELTLGVHYDLDVTLDSATNLYTASLSLRLDQAVLAAASGSTPAERIALWRDQPLDQSLSIGFNARLPSQSFDRLHNKLIQIGQELRHGNARAVKVPVYEDGPDLGDALARRGKVVAGNNTTGVLEMATVSSLTDGDGAVIVEEFNFVATASQQAFPLLGASIDVNSAVLVWVGGARQVSSSYTLTRSGEDTVLTLAEGVSAGVEVDVLVLGSIPTTDVGVSAAMAPVVQGDTTQEGLHELRKTAGIDYLGAVDSATALQTRLNTARDDSAFRGVELRGNVKLASRVDIWGGVTLEHTGALIKPAGNNGLFKVHGNGRLIGDGVMKVTDVVGYSENVVLVDGADEEDANVNNIHRLYQRSRIEGQFFGKNTGSGNGSAVLVNCPTNGTHELWQMGLTIDITGQGFDQPLDIVAGDLAYTFANANKATIQWGGSLRALRTAATGVYNIAHWVINGFVQARDISEQTTIPIIIAGQHYDIGLQLIDWVGGPGGTIKMIQIAAGARDIWLRTIVDPALFENLSSEDSIILVNGYPTAAVAQFGLGTMKSTRSDSVLRLKDSSLRLSNAKAISFRNAADNAEYDALKLDASDDLIVRGATGAGDQVIIDAPNATGQTHFRQNGVATFGLDASRHIYYPGNVGNSAAATLRNLNSTTRTQDFADADGVIGVKVAVPATLTSTGKVGSWAADANFVYFCTATDTWIKIPVSSWRVIGRSAGAIAHTGTTSETTLASVQIPANELGANGILRIESLWEYTNSANNKTLKVQFGGTNFQNVVPTTTNSFRAIVTVKNVNATNVQVGASSSMAIDGGMGTEGAATTAGAVDTTANQNVDFKATLANSGETITLKSWFVEISRGA